MKKKLFAFDIDGTITKNGYDLWNLSVSKFCKDINKFEEYKKSWKNSCLDSYQSSKLMMKQSINLIENHNYIEEYVFEKTLELIKSNCIREEAINCILKNLDSKIIFNTTNFKEGAKGFQKALVYFYKIKNQDFDIVGTEIDWNNKKIIHFNMGLGKIKKYNFVDEAYGDDPLGNDKFLLKNACKSYVILTEKNRNLDFDKNFIKLDWGN